MKYELKTLSTGPVKKMKDEELEELKNIYSALFDLLDLRMHYDKKIASYLNDLRNIVFPINDLFKQQTITKYTFNKVEFDEKYFITMIINVICEEIGYLKYPHNKGIWQLGNLLMNWKKRSAQDQ